MTRKLNHKDRRLAKKLARLFAEAGDSGAQELHAVLDKVLGRRPVAERRAFLEYFRSCVVRELGLREVFVEHAGPVDAVSVEFLVAALGRRAGRSLSHRLRENPDLLGGLRLTLGDIVYDASVAARLRGLERATAEALV
ncbi:MAG: F0F1 ATP synthase subunit delta [Opitutales bacterium]|nr:F0F1 ATP synthase subunit delta [Opitutales bacterium]